MQSLTFNLGDPTAFGTTVILVIMPLTYAWQARAGMQQQADNYKASIGEMLLMRQRSSNAGAHMRQPLVISAFVFAGPACCWLHNSLLAGILCSALFLCLSLAAMKLCCVGALQWVMDVASEQEQKEMFLAYNYLWDGQATPAPWSKSDALHIMDEQIETFLQEDVARDQGCTPAQVNSDLARCCVLQIHTAFVCCELVAKHTASNRCIQERLGLEKGLKASCRHTVYRPSLLCR